MNMRLGDKLMRGPLVFVVDTNIISPEISDRFISSIKLSQYHVAGIEKRVSFDLQFNGRDHGTVSLQVGETLTLNFDVLIHDEDGVLLATRPSTIICKLVNVNPFYMLHLQSTRNMNTLDKAKEIVDSNRQSEYGDPVENWVATALIATITQRKPITPEDVVQVMTAQKSVRAGRGHKEDTNVDQAGYAEIRERVQKAFRDGTVQKIVENLLGGWVKFGQEPPRIEATGFIKEIDTHGRSGAHMHRHELVLSVTGGTLTKLGTLSYGEEYALIKQPKK